MSSTTAQQRIAGCVRAELARRSVTGYSLIDLLGLQRTAVYDRLKGKVAFSVEELRRVAEYLDAPVEVLMGDAPADVRATLRQARGRKRPLHGRRACRDAPGRPGYSASGSSAGRASW